MTAPLDLAHLKLLHKVKPTPRIVGAIADMSPRLLAEIERLREEVRGLRHRAESAERALQRALDSINGVVS